MGEEREKRGGVSVACSGAEKETTMSTCADTVPTEKWAADNEGESSMNQFWYSAATLSCFVEEITEQDQRVACVSAPSVFFALPSALRLNAVLLEYDTRWDSVPQFQFFDYNACMESVHTYCCPACSPSS